MVSVSFGGVIYLQLQSGPDVALRLLSLWLKFASRRFGQQLRINGEDCQNCNTCYKL